MTDISTSQLYEFYLDTLEKCTSAIRNLSDEEIQYNLFEEFDVGAHSFLHEDSLAELRESGFIDDEIAKTSKAIRGRWLALQQRSWTVHDIKSRPEWNELFDLCDWVLSKSK